MADKVPKTYRLSQETLDMIAEISRKREGLTATQVIENGVRLYHRQVFAVLRPKKGPTAAGAVE